MVRKARGKGSAVAGSLSALYDEVTEALVSQGYKRALAKKKVSKASGSDFSSLFRSAMQQNPRVLPDMSNEQVEAIQRLIRGKAMAQKKKRSKKKKRNPRKGVMPPGLRKYWAKKRAKKAKRRNPAKRKKSAGQKRRATKRRAVLRRMKTYPVKFRGRTIRVTIPPSERNPKPRRRRRKSNPRPRATTPRINLGSGFTAGQIKKVARAVGRAMGRRPRVIRP